MNVCLTWEQINDGARHSFTTEREKFLLTRPRLTVVLLAQDTDVTYQSLKVRLGEVIRSVVTSPLVNTQLYVRHVSCLQSHDRKSNTLHCAPPLGLPELGEGDEGGVLREPETGGVLPDLLAVHRVRRGQRDGAVPALEDPGGPRQLHVVEAVGPHHSQGGPSRGPGRGDHRARA